MLNSFFQEMIVTKATLRRAKKRCVVNRLKSKMVIVSLLYNQLI